MNNAPVHIKLLIVAFIWGLGWVAGIFVAREIPAFFAGWIRYVVVVICFLGFLRLTNQWELPSKSQWYSLAQIGFLSVFVYQAFFMYGMKYTAAGDASLMITFNPLFTAILAVPFLGEKFDKRLALGILLAFSGVAVLGWHSPNVDIPKDERLLGDALIGFSALSWAGATILMKKIMTGDDAMSPLQLTVWASVVGLIILTPAAMIETYQLGLPDSASATAWFWLGFLAIFSTVLSYVWFADGIKIIGAARASFYVYLVPIFGIFSGWMILDEKLGISLLISFILIVGGVYLAQVKQSSSTPDV